MRHRADYMRAIRHRLGETYYRQLGEWCAMHGVALTGHPEGNEDIGHLRHFQWPGQDVILGDIRPGEAAVTGAPALQAKCAASAAIHLGRERNLNEFMGAYGEDTSFELYRFVARWLLVRGCNLLAPHAFFYSVRGARIDDCPPDLGPHATWWDDAALVGFHHEMRRLCWVNHASLPRCRVAVLADAGRLPSRSARLLFEHQIDFHYLEDRHLWEDARIDADSITVGPMRYDALVVEESWLNARVESALAPFSAAGRMIVAERADDAAVALVRAGLGDARTQAGVARNLSPIFEPRPIAELATEHRPRERANRFGAWGVLGIGFEFFAQGLFLFVGFQQEGSNLLQARDQPSGQFFL